MLSWSSGKKEISNDRPILLNIAYSEQYKDHTVTAYAWTQFDVEGEDMTFRFFKVRDGYTSSEDRYVNFETVIGSYITRVR